MSPATPPALQADGLVRIHRRGASEVRAVAGVSLRIDAGGFVALCGPSGSGKSTLLNLLGLLDRPDTGRLTLAGEPVPLDDASALQRLRRDHLGFVFQHFNLVPVLTARENVELPLYSRDFSARERRLKAEELLAAVGLGDRLGSRPAQLSGGQQQRVAVARALVSDPLLVLADEPTANLDSATADQLLDLMLELNTTRGTAFAIATHDPRVVRRAQQVVHLQDGVLTS